MRKKTTTTTKRKSKLYWKNIKKKEKRIDKANRELDNRMEFLLKKP